MMVFILAYCIKEKKEKAFITYVTAGYPDLAKTKEILKAQGFVKAIALITPPMTEADNDVYRSVHFHENMGYKLSGRLTYSGYKFGRWFDTVTMDKMLCEPHENMESVKAFDEVRGQFGI